MPPDTHRDLAPPMTSSGRPSGLNSQQSSYAGSSQSRNTSRHPYLCLRAVQEELRSRQQTHFLAPLESSADTVFEKYAGPTPESNWLIRNQLLVGAYPATQNDMETRELLSLLLGEGVKTFVCLQEEYPADSVTELQWRSGQVLRPYYRDVLTLVGEGALSGTSTVCAGKQDATRFVHFPIVDCDVTDDDDVVDLAVHLCESLLRGEVIYMHCWGGHGRTGTLACIMLHMLYGLDAAAAMGRCQECHDLRHWPVDVTSPQTSAQREQVERVIARLAQAQAGAAPTLTPTFAPLEAPALARAQATGADCASSKSDNTANELSEDDPSLTGAKRWSKALLEEDLGSDSPAAVAAYAFSRSHSRSSYDVLSEAGSGSGSEADEEPTAAPLSPGVIKRRKVDED